MSAAMFFGGFAVVEYYYDSKPTYPDAATGRIYLVNLHYGHQTYLTMAEIVTAIGLIALGIAVGVFASRLQLRRLGLR
jgi:hypothetical protein